jgi:DNA-binding transcriptional regulator YhcF (GntR family)
VWGVVLLCMARSTQLPAALQGELELDRDGRKPLGSQLADKLAGLIDAGRLTPGEQLPSVRQLADAAGVNVNTVRTVYAGLEARGLLSSEHGRGTFVGSRRGERSPDLARPVEETRREDREYRRELMRQIGELERQAAYYTRHQIVGAPDPPRRRAASQLLPATELMGVRDELLERVEQLRRAEEEQLRAITARKAAVDAAERDQRAMEIQAAGRRTPATAANPPRIVSGPGAWVLKWRS